MLKIRPSVRNKITIFLFFLIISNFFHSFNFFIFTIRESVNFIPNLVVEMNYFFFLLPFIILVLIKKKIFIKDKIFFYFLFFLIYVFIIEFLYSKNLSFLDLTRPNSIMTINLINMSLGYFLFHNMIKMNDGECLNISIKMAFIFFCIIMLYYSIINLLFVFLQPNSLAFSKLANYPNLSFFLFKIINPVTKFNNNAIFWTFSFLFFLVFEVTKNKKEKIIYLILFLICFLFYYKYNSSRSAILVFFIVVFYILRNFFNRSIFYKKILAGIIVLFIFILSIKYKDNIVEKFYSINLAIKIINNNDNLTEYQFDENEIKKKNTNISSYGSLQSNIVRFGTIQETVKVFFSKPRFIIFGMSSNNSLNIKVAGYSNHSFLVIFITSYGLLIFTLIISFFLKGIGLKKFKFLKTYFFLLFLLLTMVFEEKFYSYYSIVIYYLINKDISSKNKYEKN